jgi:glutathione S-transferase
MSSALTLISHHLCPYVQRAAIALPKRVSPSIARASIWPPSQTGS